MAFSRKRKNKRNRRDYVLDVKLSAQQRHETRVRRLTWFFGTSLILFLVVFGVWRGAEALLRAKVYENPYFAIAQVEVETDGVIAPEQLRIWAGVREGDNLMALDLTRVKRDLELVPATGSRSDTWMRKVRGSTRSTTTPSMAGTSSRSRFTRVRSRAMRLSP